MKWALRPVSECKITVLLQKNVATVMAAGEKFCGFGYQTETRVRKIPTQYYSIDRPWLKID